MSSPDYLFRLQKIIHKPGKRAVFSIDEVLSAFVNLAKAEQRLHEIEFYYVKLLYDLLHLIKRRVHLNLGEYVVLDIDISSHFDLIAPCYLFCGNDRDTDVEESLDIAKQPYRQEAWKILKQNKLFSPEWMDLYKRFCSVFYLT